jgi:hypothetical protein
MNARSLRFRLIVWYAGLLTGVFVLLSVVVHEVARHYLKHSLVKLLHRRTEQIAVSVLLPLILSWAACVEKLAQRY